MGGEDLPPEQFLVAEEEGKLASAVMLQRLGPDVYLRAMAVHRAWQGRGLGSQLVKALVAGLDQVKLVARGSAAPFYQKLGFQPAAWDVIDASLRLECGDCPLLVDCKPVPMIFEREKDQSIEANASA